MDIIRREYRLKRWVQAWYLALGALFSMLGVHLISAKIVDAHGSLFKGWGDFLIFGVPAFGCYFIALALRSRVVLQSTHISVRYAIREKSADLSEILGCQTYPIKEMSFWNLQRNISFWHLRLRGRSDYISIMQLFNVDNYFHSWLHQLPNLDRGSLNL